MLLCGSSMFLFNNYATVSGTFITIVHIFFNCIPCEYEIKLYIVQLYPYLHD